MKKLRPILITLLLGIALCGCGKKEEETFINPVVNLKAIILGTQPKSGMEEIYKELDALTIPELSCTLRFEFIPWGNEREQLNIATASGEYDFIPGGVFSDYRSLISKNAFLDINEYLYLVPDLVEHYTTYSESALKDCEMNGKLYGLPQFSAGEIQSINEGFFYRKDLQEEWGLPEIKDLATMEQYLYRAKQEERYTNEPLITDNRIWQSLWLMITKGKYLEVSSMQETPFIVVEASNPSKVLNRLELPEFKEVLFYIQKWKEDGILDSDLLAMSDNEGERGKQLMKNDLKPCETNVPIWSVSSSYIPSLASEHPEWSYGFYYYLAGNEEWYIGSLAEASVVSISSKTTHPEIAIKLLEKIHTDQRYYNLIKYGVEGLNYKKQDDYITREGIEDGNGFGWTVCTDSLLNYEELSVNPKWQEETTRVSEEHTRIVLKAKKNPLDQFQLDILPLQNEKNEIEKVKLTYFQPLVCGYIENSENAIRELQKALDQAGFQKYKSEVQRQLIQKESHQ